MTSIPDREPSGSRFVLPPNWLISRRADLLFLVGSVAISYGLFFLWRFGQLSTVQLVLVWIFVFHGPHFWGTISRTYLDKSERQQRGAMLRKALFWFALGPIVVGAGYLLENATGRGELKQAFFFFAALWAYHHVVKQHFGFMALYRAKAKEFGRREFLFHKYYIIASLWIPAVIVLANTQWVQGIPGVLWYADSGGTQRILDAGRFLREGGPIVFFAVQAVYGLSLVVRIVRGRGINLPETLIVLASVSLHWVAVMSCLNPPPGEELVGHYALVPLVTVYHNIQYHALIWHYNRQKYGGAGALEKFGAAVPFNRNLFVYFVCGLVYTGITIGVEHYGFSFLSRQDIGKELVVALIWGYSFMHYWLDSKIWHVRQDADLRRVLGFADPPVKTQGDRDA